MTRKLKRKSVAIGTAKGTLKGGAKGFVVGAVASNVTRHTIGIKKGPVLLSDAALLSGGVGAVKGTFQGFKDTRKENKLYKSFMASADNTTMTG